MVVVVCLPDIRVVAEVMVVVLVAELEERVARVVLLVGQVQMEQQ